MIRTTLLLSWFAMAPCNGGGGGGPDAGSGAPRQPIFDHWALARTLPVAP